MKRRSKTSHIIPLIAILGLAACTTVPELSLADVERRHLEFLKEGETTREQVILELGAPSSAFENERILTFRLRLDPNHGIVNSNPWQTLGLTVVFDEAGVVETYRLRRS